MAKRAQAGAKKRIFVVDDFPLVRRGLADLIDTEPDLEVCGEAGDAATALDGIAATHPDGVVIDLSLGKGPNGLELVKEVVASHPGTRIIVLSMLEESVYADRALRAGAHGFVRKDTEPDTIIEHLRRALDGGIALSSAAALEIVARATGVGGTKGFDALTDRQLEVLGLIGSGLTTREIADQLHVSIKTVESHRENIKARLALANSGDLLRTAIAWANRLRS